MEEEQSMTMYDAVGGQSTVDRLARRFYELMDELSEASHIRSMHPPSLKSSEEKFRLFLTGWMGGPQLYMEKYGHPRLRRRHFPFAIDSSARDAWMLCMKHALNECIGDEYVRGQIYEAFFRLANHMRNTEDKL